MSAGDRRLGRTLGLDLEGAMEPAPECPGCRHGELHPTGAEAETFRCSDCGQLWRLSLGFAQPVDELPPVGASVGD